MAVSLLQLQNISKYYYSDTSVTQALRKVSLEFRKGEFVAVTGESGSGKSTFLNIISGMDVFDEGEMYFNGQPTFQFDSQDWEEYRRNQIGFVFQDYSLIGHYTALDNVLSALVIQGKNTSASMELAQDYLEQVGLQPYAGQKAAQLSSGQKQRLAIARALAKNTEIIVADEPTGNLDSETGEQIVELLKGLSREKLVIMVTHNYEQAEPYVSRKIRLHDGEVVTDVPVDKTSKSARDSLAYEANLDGSADSDGGPGLCSNTYSDDSAGSSGGEQGSGAQGSGAQGSGAQGSGAQGGGTQGDGEQGGGTQGGGTQGGGTQGGGTQGSGAQGGGTQGDGEQGGTANKMAAFFAIKNIQTQKGRAALLFCFLLVTAALSFLFLGELYLYRDDRITKEYDPSAYLQENDTRLAVRKPDNGKLTEEDAERIRSIKNVKEVDLYGNANDINYYFQEGKGYQYFYRQSEETSDDGADGTGGQFTQESNKEVRGIEFLEKEQYMRSATCLTEGDLAEGNLPESRKEIVLYSPDKSLLGKEQECYFTAANIWGTENIYHTKVKVVGLLKKKTDQIYFDYRLCWMLASGMDEREYSLDYFWDKTHFEYYGNMKFYPVIGDGLTGRQIRVSKNYSVPGTGHGMLPTDLQSAFAGQNGGKSLLHIFETKLTTENTELTDEIMMEKAETHLIAGALGSLQEISGIETEVQLDDFSDQGADIIEVSEELFYKIYDRDTIQASAFIKSYGKTDNVLDELADMGYDALSTYRVSTTNYVAEKAFQRLEVIGISSLILIILLILQVLLVRSVLRIKLKEYGILKFMGMHMHQLKKITYLEMGIHCLSAVVVVLAIMASLSARGIPFIENMMQFYTATGVLLFIAYNILLTLLTVFSFNRLMERRI